MRGGRATFIIMLALAVAGRCTAAGVIARVNGEEITRSEFGRALVHSLGRASLDSYLDRALIEQEARRLGISVSDRQVLERAELEVDMRLRAVIRNSRMGPEEFRATTEGFGWDLQELRREIRDGISLTRLRYQLLTEKILQPRIDLSEAPLRRHFAQTRGPRYSAAHVLAAERRLAEGLLRALREEPEMWDSAVVHYSLDRSSVPYRGRIGPVPADSELGRVLAEMQPGELQLYEGREGWHVLRLLRDVAAEPVEFEDVRQEVRRELLSARAAEMQYGLLAELSREAKVVTNLVSEPRARSILGLDVAAWVNGEPVRMDDLAEALIDQFGPAMLQSYIERKLVVQRARERGVSVSEQEVDERLAAVADQLLARQADQRDMGEEEFLQWLVDSGVPVREFKDRLVRELVSREDVRATLLAEKMVADAVEVTDEEVRRLHEEYFGERYTVREIASESGSEARRLLEALAEGASFDLLQQSTGRRPGTWLRDERGMVVTAAHPYYGEVEGLGAGDVAGPFRFEGLYRIIKVKEHHPPSEQPSLDSVRQMLEQEVRMQKTTERVRAFLVKLKAEADIRMELEPRVDES